MPPKAAGTYSLTIEGEQGGAIFSVEAFDPRSIPGLIWWLRADLGVTTSAGTVTAWADQSGIGDSGRNAAPRGVDRAAYNTADPNYNGKATIGPFTVGPNKDNGLKTGTWSTSYVGNGTTAFTLGVVGHGGGPSLNAYFTYKTETDYVSLSNSNDVATAYSGPSSPNLAGGPSLGVGPSFMMVEFNGASSKMFAEQVETPTLTGALSATSTLGAAPQHIGVYGGGPSADIHGVQRMAEVFAYSRVLTAGEKARLRKYLNGRYGKAMTG